jgi:phage gpG-like protein
MPDHTHVKVDFGELKFWLNALADRGRNLKQLNRSLALILIEQVDENFATAGHGTWPPLAPATLARRRGGGAGAQILVDTGRLAASVNAANIDTGNDYIEVFSNVKYAKYHVSSEPRTKVPLRDFLAIDMPKFQQEALEILLVDLAG